MTANTSRGYPYPLPTDPLCNVDAYIKALADAINLKLGGPIWTTNVVANVTAANTPVNPVVTYPAGLFTATPNVAIGHNGPSLTVRSSISGGTGTTSVTIQALDTAGARTVTVYVIAAQP